MRKILLLIAIFSLSANAYSHTYYFAHAEVAWNPLTGRLEATLAVSDHDFTSVMKGIDSTFKLELAVTMDEQIIPPMEAYINHHFTFSSGSTASSFAIVGVQHMKHGILEIYLNSVPIPDTTALLEVKFDLLMDHFIDQENKITFIVNNTQKTLFFTNARRTETIQLNP